MPLAAGIPFCVHCALGVAAGDKAENGSDDPTVPIDPVGPLGGSRGERLPIVVDRYRLVRRIDEGGFGVVYAAEQRAPFRRQVAFKIVKANLASDEVLARFEAERQALALMDHPNVAHVLDAGQTKDGLPYFVMELVRGLPLIEYCRRHRPALRDLLNLFIKICDGVAHAHQRGIIHRDLKPSNILVSGEGEKAEPKIIDFGIAKATGSLLTEKTVLTLPGQLLGTLQYMSPEQALTDGLDVDVRSDIYSLGAVLYELLCGSPPVPRMKKEDFRLDVMLETIRDGAVKKPSLACDPDLPFLDKSTKLARARDLDWIVLMALEKERSRRYESALALAADFKAFLEGRPVRARAPSLAYRTDRFLRRNWKGVSATMVIGVMLVLSVNLHRQRQEERLNSFAQSFLDADATEARNHLDALARHAVVLVDWFQPPRTLRERLGLAMAGQASWSALLQDAWGADREELGLVLAAAPVGEIQAAGERAWSRLGDVQASRSDRLGAALTALHGCGANDPRWERHLEALSRMLRAEAVEGGSWGASFAPLAFRLLPAFLDRLREAKPSEIGALAATLAQWQPEAGAKLASELSEPLPAGTEDEKEMFARRQARLAVALLHLGTCKPVWALLLPKRELHDPRLRHRILHVLSSGGVDPYDLLEWAKDESLGPEVRATLLSAAAEYDENMLPPGIRDLTRPALEGLLSHRSSALHAASRFVLRRWYGPDWEPRDPIDPPNPSPADGGNRWVVDRLGHEMVIVPAGTEYEIPREGEGPESVRFDVSFALALAVISRGELEQCGEAMEWFGRLEWVDLLIGDREDANECAVFGINEQVAMHYCNWASQKNGLPREEWCYVESGEGLQPANDSLERSGYRLPTEREWEFGCRAWSNTKRPWGSSVAVAARYGNFPRSDDAQSVEWVDARAPNILGLFGMLGNVEQLCHLPDGGWVNRGSDFRTGPAVSSSSMRKPHHPGDALTNHGLGFRLARTLKK